LKQIDNEICSPGTTNVHSDHGGISMAIFGKRSHALAALARGAVLITLLNPDTATFAGEACTPHKIDLGGKTVEAGCKPLRIAFLSMATNNQYLQAGIQAARDAAAKFGATIEVFDGGWSPSTQFNQLQNILSQGKYNAILAEMNDGRKTCTILSEEAPKQGVLVAVANNPLCGEGYPGRRCALDARHLDLCRWFPGARSLS
jgi:ribose transport system substrate-binding protein